MGYDRTVVTSISNNVPPQSLTTNGTYQWGFGPNNTLTPQTANVCMRLVSPGFAQTGPGVSNNYTRTLYGVHSLRQPYPNQGYHQESSNNAVVTVPVVLSDYVFSNDYNLSLNCQAGFYTQTNANAAASGVSVTNNSVLGYQKCIANWDVPNAWWIASGQTTFTASMTAAHWSGNNGWPVAGVLIWALDQHSHSNGVWVTRQSLSPAIYGVPYPHFAATFNSAAFNSGDNITLNFAVYPWVGNSNSIVNTSDGAHTQPTPLYAPLAWYDNYSNTMPAAIALVDVLHGSDTTGKAQTNAASPFTNGAPFATLGKAATCCELSNAAVFGHADIGGSVLYISNGMTGWMGATATVNTNPWMPLVITNAVPGAFTNGITSPQAGSQHAGDRMVIGGLYVSNGAAGIFIENQNYLTFVNDVFSCSGAATAYQSTNMHFISCYITNFGQGLRGYSTQLGEAVLIKDCNLDYYTGSVKYWSFLGNVRSNTLGGVNAMWLANNIGGAAIVLTSNCMVLGNALYRLGNQSSGAVDYCDGSNMTNTWGGAFINNIFEITNASTPAGYGFAPDNLTNGQFANVIIWHNDFLGGRFNGFYDEIVCQTNNSAYGDVGFSCIYMRGNNIDQLNIKTDIFTNTGLASAWGGRTNNWCVNYGVGCSGNVRGELSGVGAAGVFCPAFAGLNTPTTNEVTGGVQASNYFHYVNDMAFGGGSATLGLGNYHLGMGTNTPSLQAAGVNPEPFDLDGLYTGYAGSGAYGSANPFAANLFFSQ